MSITSPSAAQLTSTTSKLEKEGRRRKRRSGGPGKKGKVFLEDRAGLLSLIDKVTNTQDEKTENKLSRVKNVVHGEEEEASTLRKEKGKEDKEKRKVEKEMALKGLDLLIFLQASVFDSDLYIVE
ncbi:hypothetical protein TREMEDRAFT_65375 [Tremella mesenterica DSM 1558]|uniref:uncharacterized protein n=1 Tax=Tremella mesenterica (strain ATCC 24925 / CBS 8224 / DSM 1558 / NBRC 9311 / NRRL Y-6157 / RJB 2259-6 / UBC 559-6) TaxID=578456 RepID=UPI00032C15A1|nr:uncharacterized protein TREMEDRAFT_65375 [Tremella mesenterica DSM 1558]EIW66508.1 hypothetical protein TREMEDRAFT_65375 [Tremella mesenterica DSM 1558]